MNPQTHNTIVRIHCVNKTFGRPFFRAVRRDVNSLCMQTRVGIIIIIPIVVTRYLLCILWGCRIKNMAKSTHKSYD